MPPQQPVFGPVHGSNLPPANQYDFILNPAKPTRGAWFVHAPMKTRIIIVTGGMAVLLLITLLFTSLLANSGNNSSQFLTVAQEQTELARISRLALSQATQQSTRSLATTIRLSMLTDRTAVISHMADLGRQPSSADLGKLASTSTDQKLSQAVAQGAYDTTYVSVVRQQLQGYQQTLKQVYTTMSRASERQLLQAEYNHAQLLLDQTNATD